jgi:dienelactone hydrolase
MRNLSLAAARYLLVFTAIAAAANAAEVQFSSSKIETPEPGERIWGKLYMPNGAGPHPAIVLLHTCGGLTQHVIVDWPEFLTGLGYLVLSVDTLGPRFHDRGCSKMRDRFAIQARDAYGALDYLAAQTNVDSKRVAAIGFSMGAFAINEHIFSRSARPAGSPEFRAFVSLYGRCRDMQKNTVRIAPLLQIIAEKDEKLAPSCIEAAKSIKMETHILPGVHHAFDQSRYTQIRPDFAGNMMLYDADATEKTRGLIRQFLERNLK